MTPAFRGSGALIDREWPRGGHGVRHQPRARVAREAALREPAVVRVAVVAEDEPHPRFRVGGGLQLSVGPGGPVDEERTVVGARERTSGLLEDAHGVRVVAVLVAPPPGLPCGALGALACREHLIQLPEDLCRLLVVVLENVVGAEIVERLLGPRAVGIIAGERVRLCEELVGAAEAPERAQREEARLRLTGAAIEPRPDTVERRLVPLQEEIGFGDAQIRQLAIVARRFRLQRRECRARVRVPARAVQLRGPPEIGFVSLTHDQIPQRVELCRRGHRRVRERVLVVDPDERVRGLSSIARGPGGLCLLEKDLIADGQLVGGQLLVDVERAGVIAERGGRFRVAEGRGNGEIP